MGSCMPWTMFCLALVAALGYVVGVHLLPPLQPYFLGGGLALAFMILNGFFCRWVAQTRLPVEAYRAVSDDEAAAPRATDVPRRCGVPGVCESHDCVGLAAFLTTPLSFPLAVAFLCYNGCLFGRCGRASGRRWAALIGLALLCVTGGVTLRLLLAVCVVNLDDPCEGTPHLPKKFILDQSLHRVDKLTLTVMDEHSHPLGDREFQVKLKHRCVIGLWHAAAPRGGRLRGS